MSKITNFQLYCLLVILVCPVAVLEQPHRLLHIAHNNAWLPFIPVVFSGALLVFMYSHIIKKSSQPFPLMLEEHLGKILGRILGSVYIFIFWLTSAFSLRLFIEFMKMNVLPATPISIFIGVILLLGLVAIKMGLNSIARCSEIIVLTGLPFTFIIILVSLLNNFHIDRIRPIAYIDYKSFGTGIYVATFILGKVMPVLSLAYFIPEKKKTPAIMYSVLFTYIPLLTLVTLAIIVSLGVIPSLNFVFPTFNMIRLARIGNFVQNVDIVFIGVWILGIFGAVTIPWFMACFTAQKVFNLHDYRFLAAPSMLIIGFLSIIVGRNNLQVIIWSLDIIPYFFSVFFILIPFLLFIVTLFKSTPDFPAPEPANPSDPLHKQGIPG